ncbi:Lsr2 family DNA-binding protein [Streptomyces prunicolor]|uniref:Lsr2 family DNA-binding protein n=1 Tax=Streptomyces prunicolor TaxID=67348 RepID=UPI000372954B|nr:histone-like nucleoid-structuring protein Lsr2 [Streptomyces prunicolor]
MATNANPVDASRKDEEGVREVNTHIPGVGDVTAYFLVETVDDVDQKTKEDVQTLKLSVPVEAEEEVEELDAEGDPVKNEDGSTKLKTETYWKTVHYEVDLGQASREKLEKALAPFLKNAREAQAPAVARGGYKPQALPSGVDTAAVRKWAVDNNIKVDGKGINDKGRVPAAFIEKYEEAHKG